MEFQGSTPKKHVSVTPKKHFSVTPTKNLSEICVMCDTNFKVAGRTTVYLMHSSTHDTAKLIEEHFNISVNQKHLEKARVCKPCKVKLERIHKCSLEKAAMSKVLAHTTIPPSRFKRCSISSPGAHKGKSAKKRLSMTDKENEDAAAIIKSMPVIHPATNQPIKCSLCSETMLDSSTVKVNILFAIIRFFLIFLYKIYINLRIPSKCCYQSKVVNI